MKCAKTSLNLVLDSSRSDVVVDKKLIAGMKVEGVIHVFGA